MMDNSLKEILSRIGPDSEIQERVKYWIDKIERNSVKVYTRTDIKSSSYENNIIRVSCHRDSSKNECLLWDLLHEYGHHLDNDSTGKETTPRELRAWEIAESLLKDDPLYNKLKDSFHAQKDRTLASYRYYDLRRFMHRKCRIIFINNTFIEGTFITANIVRKTFRVQGLGLENKDYPINILKQVEPIL
jgi:hypothetical protein